MNPHYRNGYNDGLSLARQDAATKLPFRSAGGIRLAAAERYGGQNGISVNSMKAGFRKGYEVGVQEAELIGTGVR